MIIMKRFIYFAAIIMTCLLGIACMSSCQNNDEDVDREKIIMIEVDSEPCDVILSYWPDETTILEPGMRIKEENSREWKMVSQKEIKGFTYEAGYYYVLKVKKTTITNPPANPIGILYTLLDVVNKEKK